ncbi:tolloid-like protein 2 isoform X1 [Calliphora vicina]|uniref:tolloid-like protein 2 isoform X1 n=2 Tax=Calliphora vicina TaxID=7373 RepID=UPI00325A4B2E
MPNNYNIILNNQKFLSASGPPENECFLQPQPQPSNETTKCCQRNVAKQCCHNYDKHKTKTQTTTTTSISFVSNQQNQIQQRNFCFKSNFSNTTTKTTTTTNTQQQQQQKFTTFSTTTTNTLTKLYRDLQKMSKYLLSLLVIFNMLPLFYAECDQTFVSRIGGPQNGTFSAPLLHNLKNHSRQCLYTFLAGPGQRVEVIFKTFNLRGNPPDGSAVGELPSCVHEYMDIYSEVQSSEPAELINSPFGGRYCGTIPPRQRISMYRAIAISFFTNKNITTPDLFEGTFRFINASEYEIGIPIAGSPCSYTITPSLSINKTGVLISPTYPGAYPKDMSCTYQFLGESNQRVRLEFRDFDLFFGGPHCPFDYVKVYDGPDNSSALIGTYCGQQRNLVLYSSESSLFVHFFTLSRTANTQNRGFKGIYEFSESFVKLDFIRENDGIHIRGSECDQKILSRKESTGFVLSPNYPYPYIPKTVCRYFIYGMQDAQHLERVRLEFTAFNIPRVESKDKDKETNCSDGYLKIYLKGQETADAYDKFDYELCGNETQRVVSDGPRLAMVFSSGELQGRGFKGKYVFETEYKIPGTAAPDGSCSFTYVSSSKKRGELNSPRYPSNYPSDTNCSYLFLAEPNEQVTIVFDHFKIKADGNSNVTAGAYGSIICFEDWLEMYVVYRDNNDRFLGRYCGMTAPGPVESPRGAVGLRITLHTDQENVASGFKARYFFETAKSEIGDCGGNFSNEDSGIITSPNYPAGYKAPGRGMASMACNWLMTARPGYKLSIHFEQFSLEGDPANRGCPAAVLRLWVNVDSDQPPLELCGEKPPIEQWHYISTGQTARISFTTSDKTVGAQGFRIVWTEIQDSGPGPPSIGLLCESTYHFQCEVGYCISDKLRCDGVKNCGPNDDSDELHCITKAQAEDHGVLIITTLLVVSFLICLLCILYHSRRKRRQQLHQMGLHRNAHYDSQTSATGLNSSRRHLQSGGASIAGSLHGINSGNLIIPPAPMPPRAIHQPPHICISGSSLDLGPGNYPGILINGDSLDDSSTTSNDSIGSIPFLNECETDNMGHMIMQQGENV